MCRDRPGHIGAALAWGTLPGQIHARKSPNSSVLPNTALQDGTHRQPHNPGGAWGKADPRPHKSRSSTSSKCSWGGLEQQTHPSYLRKGLRGSRLRGWIRGWIPALAPRDLGLELPDLGLTPQDLGLSAPAPGAEITSQEMRERGTETLISISLQSWGQRGQSPRKAPGDRGRDRGRDRGGLILQNPKNPG